LLSPGKIGADGANVTLPRSRTAWLKDCSTPASSIASPSNSTKGNESDHFWVKQMTPKVGGLHSFATARRTISGFEAMLWLRKGFGFAGDWTVAVRMSCLRSASDFKTLTKRENQPAVGLLAAFAVVCDAPLHRGLQFRTAAEDPQRPHAL
jgi:hypothetical protein